MDPNDGDLALIAELKRLDEMKAGVIPIASLSAALQEAFETTCPGAACPVIDGKICIQPADWIQFFAFLRRDVMQRMRLRSLRAAIAGPTADDLLRAPILSHWIAIEHPGCDAAVLLGSALDHPTCSDDLIMTSRLCGIAGDGSWARTVSRWYRLEHHLNRLEFIARYGMKIDKSTFLPLEPWQTLVITEKEQEELKS